MGLIMCIFHFSNLIMPKESPALPPTDYLGLAQLGVIPTSDTCSYQLKEYESTGVIAQNINGQKSLLVRTKLGDESCFIPIS